MFACLISLNLSCSMHRKALYMHVNESELNTKSGRLFNLSSCPGADKQAYGVLWLH